MRHLIAFVFVMVISSVTAQTLKEAVQEAMMTHPEVLLNRAQTMTAQQGIAEAKGAYYPSIDVNTGFGREWTDSPFTKDLEGETAITLNRTEFNIAMTQNLFAGGAIAGEVKRNFFVFQSQDYKTLGVANQIALDVTDAYLNVILQTKLVQINKLNLIEHKRLYGLINLRSQAGISRAAEYDQAESRVALAESNLINAEGNYREAQVRYRKVVGSLPDGLIDPIIPDEKCLPSNLAQALQIGLDNHPLVKSGSANIKEAKEQHKIANAAFLPRVDGVLSAGRNRNLDGVTGRNNDNLAMIRVSYNIFKGGGDLGRLRKTAFQVQEAFETRDKTILEMQETLGLAYNAWNISKLRSKTLALYVRSTTKTKASYFEQFQIGQRSLLDLLNTQNEENNAKTEYYKAKNDEIFARYRILSGIGNLISFIGESQQHSARRFKPRLEINTLPITKTKERKVNADTSLNTNTVKNPPVKMSMSLDASSIDNAAKNSIKIVNATLQQISAAKVNVGTSLNTNTVKNPPVKVSTNLDASSIDNAAKNSIKIVNATLQQVPAAAVQLLNTVKGPRAVNGIQFIVQVAALKSLENAEKMKTNLIAKGFQSMIEPLNYKQNNLFRVTIGPFISRFEAEKMQDLVSHNENLKGMVRKVIL